MPRTSIPPQSPDLMTPNQLARRDRLLEAVPELVAKGFDEEMQMKDIAEQAGVALGTIYRYFSSKDHLIAAALVHWAEGLQAGVARGAARLPQGAAADRLAGALHQALRAYRRRPEFARLLVYVANSTDPYASQCYSQMGDVVYHALGLVLEDIDDERRARIMLVIGAVWYHALVEWTNGRMTIEQVEDTLDSAAHLVLP